MPIFRLILLVLLIALVGYTVPVIARDGWNFFTPFFGAIVAGGWQGQFNTDFQFMLILSALWTAWRNEFSMKGLGLAVLAFLFGAGFLCVYLLHLSFAERGDARRMAIGARLG